MRSPEGNKRSESQRQVGTIGRRSTSTAAIDWELCPEALEVELEGALISVLAFSVHVYVPTGAY